MNTNQNQFVNKKLAKLAAENTALNGCRADMSDVSFVVGKGNMTLNVMKCFFIFVALFAGRILLRQRVIGSDIKISVMDIIFWIIIAVMIIITVVSSIALKKSEGINVFKKTVFCKGNCWRSDEISNVVCSSFSQIRVYSNGKKILSFSWDLDNSEMFIAWVKKCGITFEDRRIGIKK